MSDNKNTATALDDERRVKVLSPGQLVAKRFFRNRLAMVDHSGYDVCFLLHRRNGESVRRE